MFKPILLILTVLFSIQIVKADEQEKDIYLSLLASSHALIAHDHCEIKANPLTVGAYLSEYFDFFNSKPERAFASFSCSDESEEINCTLTFGQKANFLGHEGWDRILRFHYDFKKKMIDESTLTCIDVP